MRRATVGRAVSSVRRSQHAVPTNRSPYSSGRDNVMVSDDFEEELRSLEAEARTSISSRGVMGTPRMSAAAVAAAATAGAPTMEAATVCMTVVEYGPIIGCACYDQSKNEIILETCHASGYESEDMLERFIATTRPNLVLLSNKIVSNEPLFQIVTRPPSAITSAADEDEEDEEVAGDNNGAADNTGQPSPPNIDQGNKNGGSSTPMLPTKLMLQYRILKSGDFEVKSCRTRILSKLRVLSLIRRQRHGDMGAGSDFFHPPQHRNQFTYYQPSTYHSLASMIDFDSKVQIQAIGSLLAFLETNIFRFEDGGTITVNDIRHASTMKHMKISSATFAALHIFATEHHPLQGTRGEGRSKEGFSLYSLLDRTNSMGGRKLLRQWMLKPLFDIDAIKARQDAIECFVQPVSEQHALVICKYLKKIGPVDSILIRIQKCTTKPLDFLALTKAISSALAIYDTLGNNVLPRLERQHASRRVIPTDENENIDGETLDSGIQDSTTSPTLLRSIYKRCDVEALRELMQQITQTVDEDATFSMKHSVVIRDGFSAELDSLKEKYERLSDVLSSTAKQIHLRHPHLRDLSVGFIPQVGFLVILPISFVFNEENEVVIDFPGDFNHTFNQDDDAFFKNDDVRLLDSEIGDLDGLIKDTEGMIVAELEDLILDRESELRETFNALSELDCILSLAGSALDSKYVRPEIIDSDHGRIYIENGRHPLQEMAMDTEFVPNDTDIDVDSRINVITGPNFSGKSCYARQVGILVYMAHIGSFLPCTKAIISLTDHIFSRFDAAETCAVPQSSFQLTLTQMATILRRTTQSSLVLIDEFGKGTSPASGIALLAAALKKLAEIRCKVVCTTHFLEMFSLKQLEDGEGGIKASQMTVRLPEANDDRASPLFKLRDGVASSSAGLVCAQAAGVNPIIVARAKEINQALREGRRVKPLESALPPKIVLTDEEKAMLRCFYSVADWQKATDEELRALVQRVAWL